MQSHEGIEGMRLRVQRETLRQDGIAGLVLGLQSVPDGLATGLLTGISPLAGLNAYMVGLLAGTLATGSTFMAIQGTGAMAMIIADTPAVQDSATPETALFTLAVLTGVVMLVAGILRLGFVLRFVSNAVMVAFINAVGVNIILGQLANFTGYAAEGANRITRAIATVLSPMELDLPSVVIGVATIALIIAIERTRLGALGLVIAVVATSGAVAVLGLQSVATLADLGIELEGLPAPVLPSLGLVPVLVIPALSLAFVGLVQGAGISANFPNPDGTYGDPSRDFVGQGVANVAAGVFQGMPVGGSVSASALNRAAGGRSRQSLLIAGIVIGITIVALGGVVQLVAMPALAGLLMLIGFRTIKPADLLSVWRTGPLQKTVLAVTFTLTMIIPLQYAVLVGVGMSTLLFVIRQSNRLVLKRRLLAGDHDTEVDPPADLPPGEVVVLQPYGSLFFAAAPAFEAALPKVGADSSRSVVIVRLRGRSDLGTTFIDVLGRYAQQLGTVGSKLVLVSTNERIDEQLAATGIADVVGRENIYRGDERVGATLARAREDADAWVRARTTPVAAG
ncbi:MAG TPA: SulP family inorganic anion transporter [Candidatus Limnocylindrales bacterium]|nr:SulP family inorganic anion transporter [Candidatus Limnocylindrales bacterium]